MMLKRLFAIALAVTLCLSTTACKKEPNPIPLDTAAMGIETPYTVEVDKTITKTITLPLEGATAVVSEVSPGIEVTYTAPELTIKGLAVGDNIAVITFSAETYDDAALNLSVTVTAPPPPQLEVAISSELLGINSGVPSATPIAFKMESGIGAQMVIHPAIPGDLTITAESSNPNLEVTLDGTIITLNPTEAGSTTLTIRATQPGFSDAVAQCAVEVKPPHAKLELTGEKKTPVPLLPGQSDTVPLAYDGTLSFSVDTAEIVAVEQQEQTLKLTGITPGNATITLTAGGEGYQDSTLQLSITVTEPPPPPSPYQDIIDDIVKHTNLERASMGLPALKTSAKLSAAAAVRAEETAVDQSHTRPDGRRGLTAIQDAGLGNHTAEGENLAGSSDTETGAQVVERWMDSPAHRDAILHTAFTTIGVGVYYDGEVYRYCQLFVGAPK